MSPPCRVERSSTILLPYAGGGATSVGRRLRGFFSVLGAFRASAFGCRGTDADRGLHAKHARRAIAQQP
jgi:hypothetical protein